jgi:hypothetical protein
MTSAHTDRRSGFLLFDPIIWDPQDGQKYCVYSAAFVTLVFIRAHLASDLQVLCRYLYERTIKPAACTTAVVTVTAMREFGFSAALKTNRPGQTIAAEN